MEEKKIDTEVLKERIRELVQKGNVSRIQVCRGENTILNIPVNAGIVGGVLGVVAAPWAVVAGTIATLGLDCSVDFIREDGETLTLTDTELGQKAVSAGTFVMDNLKNVVSGAVSSLTENKDPSVIETTDYQVDSEE